MWAYPRLFSVISNSMEHMDSSLLGPKVPRVSLPTRIFRGDQTRNLRIPQNLSIPGTWGINGTGLTRPSNFLNFCQFSTSPDPPGALRRVPAGKMRLPVLFPSGEMPARLICQPYFCWWKIAGLGLLVTNCLALKFPVVLLLLSVIAGGIIAGGIIASVRQWLFWSPLIYHYITTF